MQRKAVDVELPFLPDFYFLIYKKLRLSIKPRRSFFIYLLLGRTKKYS